MNGAKDNKRLSQIELDVLIDFFTSELLTIDLSWTKTFSKI